MDEQSDQQRSADEDGTHAATRAGVLMRRRFDAGRQRGSVAACCLHLSLAGSTSTRVHMKKWKAEATLNHRRPDRLRPRRAEQGPVDLAKTNSPKRTPATEAWPRNPPPSFTRTMMAAMIAAANATYGHPARGQRATFQIGKSGCYLLTSKAAFTAMTRGRLMRGRLASRSSIRDGPSICLLFFTTTCSSKPHRRPGVPRQRVLE